MRSPILLSCPTQETRLVVKRSKAISSASFRRSHWTARSTMRRYTRLSNGFVRKLENHAAATDLNLSRVQLHHIYRTLRSSPAMAAGITDRLWSVEDLVALWEAYEQRGEERAAERRCARGQRDRRLRGYF